MPIPEVHIIGTGPAALMAGTYLAEKGHAVNFYDQNKAPARKFLVAGNGGFNLTHSEELKFFLQKYNRKEIQDAVQSFTNNQFITFLEKIGIPTYVGSSGKIFPKKGIKPIQVLNAWINYLKTHHAHFHFEHRLKNFDHYCFTVEHKNEEKKIDYKNLVLALGGASWKKTGSDGSWLQIFEKNKIPIQPFEASNSGFELKDWDKNSELAGEVIKNCVVQINNTAKKGEVVLTSYGIEGSPIYYLNKFWRENPESTLSIDFRPTDSESHIKILLQKSKNHSEGLKALKLSKAVQALIKNNTTKEQFASAETLAKLIKSFPLQINGSRPIDEVISTIGGVPFEAITKNFRLNLFPNISLCGEMLDWDAPTGGYLIQGCVSTGYMVGKNIADHTCGSM